MLPSVQSVLGGTLSSKVQKVSIAPRGVLRDTLAGSVTTWRGNVGGLPCRGLPADYVS